MEELLDVPEVGRLTNKPGPAGEVGEEVSPVPRKVQPDAFVVVQAQKLSGDLHGEDFGIAEPGWLATLPQFHATQHRLQQIIDQDVDLSLIHI